MRQMIVNDKHEIIKDEIMIVNHKHEVINI